MNLRIGKIQAVCPETGRVRVYFENVRLMSGWLNVIRDFSRYSALSASEEQGHEHIVQVPEPLPCIGDTVLCIYNDGFNADGFVLGRIQ